VKLDTRMGGEEFANQLGFVGGEVVEDDMNLLPTRAQRYDFLEEGDEVAAGVAGAGFTVHASGLAVADGPLRDQCADRFPSTFMRRKA